MAVFVQKQAKWGGGAYIYPLFLAVLGAGDREPIFSQNLPGLLGPLFLAGHIFSQNLPGPGPLFSAGPGAYLQPEPSRFTITVTALDPYPIDMLITAAESTVVIQIPLPFI